MANGKYVHIKQTNANTLTEYIYSQATQEEVKETIKLL